LPGLDLSHIPDSIKLAHFDLSMVIYEGPENIVLSMVYNTDLFDADTAAQILKDYEVLLQQVSAQPEQRVLEISINPVAPGEVAEASSGPNANETQEQFSF
jgi:non-ribosomal peptide synthetase component F